MLRTASPFLLVLFLATRLAAVEESGPRSSHLTELIRASSPKFVPPPTTPVAAPVAAESVASDPDVIEMPKFFVEDSKLARIESDKLLGKRELAAKMRREYRNSLSDLGWALNSFSIPFLTPSVAARAQAKYESDRRAAEISRLGRLLEVVDRVDPKAAADARRELTKR